MKRIIVAVALLLSSLTVSNAHPNHSCHSHANTTSHCK